MALFAGIKHRKDWIARLGPKVTKVTKSGYIRVLTGPEGDLLSRSFLPI